MKIKIAAFFFFFAWFAYGCELIYHSVQSLTEYYGAIEQMETGEIDLDSCDLKSPKFCHSEFLVNGHLQEIYLQNHLTQVSFQLPTHPYQWIFSPPPNSNEL